MLNFWATSRYLVASRWSASIFCVRGRREIEDVEGKEEKEGRGGREGARGTSLLDPTLQLDLQ